MWKKSEVLHEKLKTVLPMGILKKKKSRPPTSPSQKIIIFIQKEHPAP